jgi:hypothetical protein
MDGQRFDDLARTFARRGLGARSRRAFLKSLFGGAAGVLAVGAFGVDAAEAKDKQKPGGGAQRPPGAGCTQPLQCAPGSTGAQACCNGQCTDTGADRLNCGACRVSCNPGQVCVGGRCGCAPDQVTCGAGCCAAGQRCDPVTNSCTSCPAGRPACGSQCCPDAGYTCQSGACVCPADRRCDNECCPVGKTCAGGACCDPQLVCGDECCAVGERCCNGTCIGLDVPCCGDGERTCLAARVCCPMDQACTATGCGCASGQTTCDDGQGGSTCCATGEQCCNGTCIGSDLGCCGTGERLCLPGGHCCPLDKTCTADACCDPQLVCGDACCPVGEYCCNGVCIGLGRQCCAEGEAPCVNVEGFGFCCGAGEQCCNNWCSPAGEACCEEFQLPCGEACCDEGLGCCGTGCVDHLTDRNNCGECGVACDLCSDCVNGFCVERECPGCHYCDQETGACVDGCPGTCLVCDEVENVCRGPRIEPPYCEVCVNDGNGGSVVTGESCNGTHCCWGDDHCDGGRCCAADWKNCCGRCVWHADDCSAYC